MCVCCVTQTLSEIDFEIVCVPYSWKFSRDKTFADFASDDSFMIV